MPVVEVKFRPYRNSHQWESGNEVFSLLQTSLAGIIAEGLDVPGNNDARLTANDIEVGFRFAGEFDTGSKNLEIVVLANDYHERAANLQSERVPKMRQAIRALLDKAGYKQLTVSLYVHLGIGGYDEF